MPGTASGGAGRFEAVPASQIATLKEMSGPAHEAKSKSLGRNVRECTLMLEKARRLGDKLPEKIAGEVMASCGASENRQLFDLAGQLFGRQRKFDDAIKFFERSLEKDPNAIFSGILSPIKPVLRSSCRGGARLRVRSSPHLFQETLSWSGQSFPRGLS